MCLKAAWLFDHGQPCGAESNAAKLMAAEAGFEACDVALQTHAATATPREFHVERLWREVRLYKIAPGLAADGAQLRQRARAGAAQELLSQPEDNRMKAVTPWKLVARTHPEQWWRRAPVRSGAQSRRRRQPDRRPQDDAKVAFDITAGEPGRHAEHSRTRSTRRGEGFVSA